MRVEHIARYRNAGARKTGGATFTPPALADFVARQLVAALDLRKDAPLRVLDPALGEGALLISLLTGLHQAGFTRIEATGFETDPHSLACARQQLARVFPQIPFDLRPGSFLDFAWPAGHPEAAPAAFDVLIANPPYVRTQIMGSARSRSLARSFGLSGRADLYYAFLLAMLPLLAPGGAAGIIVSNRFMSTRSGAAVRAALCGSGAVRRVWDLGDTRLFGAAVLPAVLLIGNNGAGGEAPPFSSIYRTAAPAHTSAATPLDALGQAGIVATPGGRCFQVTHGRLDHGAEADGVWRIANVSADRWLGTVAAHTWRRFGEIGSVRVGIKTCADRVFIRSDWDRMPAPARPELLFPVTTHHVARRFRALDGAPQRRVLYPHTQAGGRCLPVDLAEYPRDAEYLERHRAELEARSYVLRAGRRWYELWVPQEPACWSAPKLVFRDISEEPVCWLDLAGTIVNGDCYWLEAGPEYDGSILWLAAAVANSRFIAAFYDRSFPNRLYSGRRRFITQYVSRFPLPDPGREESHRAAACARQIYERVDDAAAVAGFQCEIDTLIDRCFGVEPGAPAPAG